MTYDQPTQKLAREVATLRDLLQAIVNDAGACDEYTYSVTDELIDTARTYLKENP